MAPSCWRTWQQVRGDSLAGGMGPPGDALHHAKCAWAPGMRVVNPGWGWWPSWLDVYHNLRLLPKIQAPVLVMHVSCSPNLPRI